MYVCVCVHIDDSCSFLPSSYFPLHLNLFDLFNNPTTSLCLYHSTSVHSFILHALIKRTVKYCVLWQLFNSGWVSWKGSCCDIQAASQQLVWMIILMVLHVWTSCYSDVVSPNGHKQPFSEQTHITVKLSFLSFDWKKYFKRHSKEQVDYLPLSDWNKTKKQLHQLWNEASVIHRLKKSHTSLHPLHHFKKG